MTGPEIHQELKRRCEQLMLKSDLDEDEKIEFAAVVSACEAYEGIMFPLPSLVHSKEG